MLADHAKINVTGGDGGHGSVSFRREAHVPRGGPDGGDGAHGGSVWLVCSDDLRDLRQFGRKVHFRAGRGAHGEGSGRDGKRGENLEIPVPPGTQVTLEDGVVHDLVRPGQRLLVARGGSGGRGNKHFTTSTRQAPRFAERGLPGEEQWLELQLKLLADAGLVGLPNAGKSSLLAALTRATPKIANYPFTTLEPVLGTIEADNRQLVLADIPGLIEGASDGLGLGHDFLAHIERCQAIAHVLDVAPLDGSDPAENHRIIEAELAAHDSRLAGLPRILVLSKIDLVSTEAAEQARREWRQRMGPEVPVLLTSSATATGLGTLTRELLRLVPPRAAQPEELGTQLPEEVRDRSIAEHMTYRPRSKTTIEVERTGPGSFRVVSPQVTTLVRRFDLENEDAMAHVERRLRALGVIDRLEALGFEPGDEVDLGGELFELEF
ncbi:MAG: GTPase ObgE [Patulibacter sp.]